MQPQQDSPITEPANSAVPPAPFTLPDSVSAGQVAAPAERQTTPSMANMPQLADDGDLIEKEWVAQVKHIISTTANDPFEQSQQIAQLKADYMQKRYGKVIKTEE